jgi:hypothetical protein
MTTTATKVNGHKVNVFFNGPQYIMYSEYFGVLAIATRDYDKGEVGKKSVFHIVVGNEHTIGGSCSNGAVVAALKRVINKSENQYVPTKVEYTEEVKELTHCNLQIKVIGLDGAEM